MLRASSVQTRVFDPPVYGLQGVLSRIEVPRKRQMSLDCRRIGGSSCPLLLLWWVGAMPTARSAAVSPIVQIRRSENQQASVRVDVPGLVSPFGGIVGTLSIGMDRHLVPIMHRADSPQVGCPLDWMRRSGFRRAELRLEGLPLPDREAWCSTQ